MKFLTKFKVLNLKLIPLQKKRNLTVLTFYYAIQDMLELATL